MACTANTERFEFRAHSERVLALMINSLYTQKEIFLRELISNASDALDAFNYESLLDTTLIDDEEPLAIRLEADPGERTLAIHDNGIGMTRQEVVENLGMIARSGTRELLDRLRVEGHGALPDLIGLFGVGFYSAFMVADHVTVISRRAGQADATRWESDGHGTFTVSDADRSSRGTTVILNLKASDPNLGLEDYTNRWIISRIVKRYSDFVVHPIVFTSKENAGHGEPDAPRTGAETLNSQRPLWAKRATEATEDEYRAFYRHISDDWNEPLLRLSAKAEGRMEWQTLCFVPMEPAHDLYYHATPCGLQLHARQVLVIEQCPDLLPRYLRFVKGVVDVLDLPLNISRQALQETRHIADIRRWLTRKLLDLFEETRVNDREKYLRFWRGFGRALKEGLGTDHENHERLVKLCLFESSDHSTELTTLDEYVARMKNDQVDIFYLSGDSREALEHAPHVEAALERGYEVLYLVDPVDDLVVQALPEHASKRLKSLGQGTLTLDDSPEQGAQGCDFADLLKRLETSLSLYVKQARLSSRLTTSPVCLTGEEYDHTPRMERLLLKGRGSGPRQRRILEVNPRNPIVISLQRRVAAGLEDVEWESAAQLLLGYALLAEGTELSNSVKFRQALLALLEGSLGPIHHQT